MSPFNRRDFLKFIGITTASTAASAVSTSADTPLSTPGDSTPPPPKPLLDTPLAQLDTPTSTVVKRRKKTKRQRQPKRGGLKLQSMANASAYPLQSSETIYCGQLVTLNEHGNVVGYNPKTSKFVLGVAGEDHDPSLISAADFMNKAWELAVVPNEKKRITVYNGATMYVHQELFVGHSKVNVGDFLTTAKYGMYKKITGKDYDIKVAQVLSIVTQGELTYPSEYAPMTDDPLDSKKWFLIRLMV